jgi:hypothetical protein
VNADSEASISNTVDVTTLDITDFAFQTTLVAIKSIAVGPCKLKILFVNNHQAPKDVS